ncbi:serine 3-dehydrogenase [Pectobacterium versatile]|uniref:SDR family NAD(P)-dependent oxidoreductase n=1 Tax=Pectobacterium versatile TaxID=2488639 RepID=UPI000DAB3832|nr:MULTISPECIES: SDR family NAD(P)-dependent oxidoreductase [Pectobacterium]MCL6339472.1 SDR family NAD(P)-dependent oxidoreductase [Pectobacterium carotovorum subsp. carotovorum]MCL6343731.1 SDR family NAD(P)-dependent oxidoreductase [Pectobacterium carotovorum subsp. carotovorum]GBO48677.1 serine 3-dehydrogenase [Pectobacterium versatile]
MKRVLITGASSGIGQQLALDYARDGWDVLACGRDEQRLNALTAAFPAIRTIAFDMTNLADTQQALERVTVDLVILSAGTCEYLDNGVVDAGKVRRVLTTNVIGPVNCLSVLLPQLANGSHLALVGSTASLVALPRAEAYGASKAALAYFARSLSLDLQARNITVSLILPGFVDTPLTARNDFPMPMLISVSQASATIRRGLAKKKREIAFPLRFALLLNAISVLPQSWQRLLASRLVR